jgi:hypothetical protein
MDEQRDLHPITRYLWVCLAVGIGAAAVYFVCLDVLLSDAAMPAKVLAALAVSSVAVAVPRVLDRVADATVLANRDTTQSDDA